MKPETGEVSGINATLTQLTRYHFICRGTGIEWPELDYHLSIEAMLSESRMAKE